MGLFKNLFKSDADDFIDEDADFAIEFRPRSGASDEALGVMVDILGNLEDFSRDRIREMLREETFFGMDPDERARMFCIEEFCEANLPRLVEDRMAASPAVAQHAEDLLLREVLRAVRHNAYAVGWLDSEVFYDDTDFCEDDDQAAAFRSMADELGVLAPEW